MDIMNQDYIKQYYYLQYEYFCEYIKSVVDTLAKILELNDNQVTEQQRAVISGLKAIFTGQMVEDIKRDLASCSVTMETVEKRVQIEVDFCKAVIDMLNPSPMGKIFLELILSEQANAMRTNLKNQVLWLSMVNEQ